jgi:hypothetical protein
MAGPISLEDIGYADLPEVPGNGSSGPRSPMSLEDMGYVTRGAKEAGSYKSPEELGYYPEELESAKRMMEQQGLAGPSMGDIVSGAASRAGEAINYVAPKFVGGKGEFGLSSLPGMAAAVPGAIYQGAKEAVMAPGRMMSGEVPMFDQNGIPTEAGIAESLKFSAVSPSSPLTRGVTSIPQAVGRKRIAQAIQEDISTGKVRGLDPARRTQFGPRVLPGATPEELSYIASEGVPVTGYDVSAGPNLKNLIEAASQKAPDKAPVVSLAQGMAERSANTGQYISGTVDKIAGRPLATGDEFKAAVDAISAKNNPAYTSVMSLPEHQSVFSPELKTLLEDRPVFAKILRERAQGAINRGDQPPAIYGPKGSLNIQPFNAPSLEYLDGVYRNVRDMASQAYQAGDTQLGKDYKEAANALRAELDKVSAKNPAGESVYKTIRDDASELFGARNALEAGYKFTRAADPLKLNEITAAYQKYSPGQKEQFRIGLLANIKDEALKGGANKVTSWFDGSNPKMYEKIEKIIGPNDAIRLGNQIRIQKVLNEGFAPSIPQDIAPGKVSRITLPGAAGLTAGAVVVGEKVMENMPQVAQVLQSPITQGTAVGMGVATTAFVGKKLLGAAKNAYEARVSQAILDAVNTRDPAKIADLERYSPQTLKIVLDRASALAARGAISEAGQSGSGSKDDMTFQPIEERRQRKSGGRTNGNAISAEVKRVRALLAEKTASMLSVPDDAIATALHLAKRT